MLVLNWQIGNINRRRVEMVVFALTLIRHGETLHNKDSVIQGQLDVPLSPTGVQQAESLGRHLQHQKYTHIYVSDLRRAKQTAETILQQNLVCKGPVIQDPRLRERKFGVVEGKSFKFLKEAANKANKSVASYIPSGAETVQQVRERAIVFFQELCSMFKEKEKKEELEIKDVSGVPVCQSLLASDNETSTIISLQTTCDSWHKEKEKLLSCKRKREYSDSELSRKVECSEKTGDHSVDIGQNGGIISSAPLSSKVQTTDVMDRIISDEHNVQKCTKQTSNYKNDVVTFVIGNFNHKIPGNQSVSEKSDTKQIKSNGFSPTPGTSTESEQNAKKVEQFSVTFADDIIKSHIISCCNDPHSNDCPNVSLSPLVDHCLAAQSSTSGHTQGQSSIGGQAERRLSVCSSCDDTDSSPVLVANVLIVSHGGLLRELLRHFVEDLGCTVPGGKKQALRISPNAGLSKFTVSVEEGDRSPKIICHQIHDKQHLGSGLDGSNLVAGENVAL